ncbi:MAG: glycosyltransferase family 39 protein [bacterium]|nr:glycosyltransferase family 39 protein [bacterium]
MTEIPFVFLLTGFVYYSIKYLYETKTKDIIIASLFLAFGILTRPFALYLIIPLFALIIAVKFGDWKGILRHSLLAALVCGVVLAPWIYKNVQQYHSASLQYLSGIALWTNVYKVDKLPIVDSQMLQKEKQLIKAHPAESYIDAYKTLEAAGYSPAEYDRALTAISLESIKAHPITYISKTAKNFIKLSLYPKYAFGDYLVIDQNENLRPNNYSRYFYYAFNDLAHKVNYPVILLTLLGISGIAMSLVSDDKKRKIATWFIAAIILACLAIPAATIIPNVRYRIVIDQLLMLFASYAFLIFWRRLQVVEKIKKIFAG